MADTTHADATHADTRRRVRSRPAAEPGPSTGGRLVAPADVAAASTALRDGIGDRATVRFAGNGTKAGWGGALDPIDLTVSTGGLQQVIRHNPADMTAAVQAGMPLTRLQSVLAEHGQWLALDPPSAAGGATLGGLLATGDAGPRRLRYGSLRDLAIGATLVLADGTVVHSGSHVIKNVAGYDLTKLFHGSLGSLGLIAEVIVRLHPLPPTSATVLARCSLAEATAAVPELTCRGAEPTAVEWIGPADTDETGTLLVRV
nr:FAD-binding oxidoreductase [Actinomycetota bacterium]